MTNFVVIVVALGGGYLLRRWGQVPTEAPKAINAFILWIAMPAVVLLTVPKIEWSPLVVFPLLTPVLVAGGAAALVTLAARPLGWDPAQRTAVFLTTGLGNTSFVGFPLILAYYGPEGLAPGVLCDQASFFLLATVGIGTAAVFRARQDGASLALAPTLARRLVTFPPLLAFPVALLWPPEAGLRALEPVLSALAAPLGPLALFSVGVQLSFSKARADLRTLGVGLAYKLVVAPALVLGVALALGLSGPYVRISVFEAAMAPMITSAVVASEFRAAGSLATVLVGVGIPLSFLTTALWALALNSL